MFRTALDLAATPRVILCVGWLAFAIYAFPGLMSYDSVWQLGQARHLEPYNDWHPPMMAVIWHVTDAIIAGPFPMLVLQSVAFLYGAFAILGRAVSARTAAVLAVLILIMPPNIIVMSVIWKDSQMAGYLLAGLALLLSDRRAARLAGYGLIWLATAMRYNAAAATCALVILPFAHGRAMAWWKRYALGAAVWLGVTALAFAVSARLVEAHTHVWEVSAAPNEIAGMVRFAPEISDDELRADTPGVHWIAKDHIAAFVRSRYAPDGNFLHLTRDTDLKLQVMEEPKTPEDIAAMPAAWKTLIAKYPGAFLRHRVAVFEVQVDKPITGRPGAGFNYPGWEDKLNHRAQMSKAQQWAQDFVLRWGRRTRLPVWPYIVIAIVLLPLCRRHRLPLILFSSAVLHELGVFMVAPAIDYRYSHWLVIATVLGVIVLFAERYRAGSAVAATRDLG